MASSQVEFASSSTFGCVLKDHNRRDRCRDSNSNSIAKSQSNFQRNLKELVRDHLNSCISISPRSSNSVSNENSRHQKESFSCWGCSNSRSNNQKNPNLSKSKNREAEERMSSRSRRRSRVLDTWTDQQPREMITTMYKQNPQAEVLELSNPHSVSSRVSSSVRDSSPAPPDSSVDVKVSSLVQKWRGYEAEAKHNNPNSNQNQNQSNGVTGGGTSSASSIENGSSVEASETTADDRVGLHSSGNGRQISSTQGNGDQVSDGERERIRVSDIIRKWTRFTKSRAAMGRDENESEQQQQQQPPATSKPSLARLQIGVQGGLQMGFHPVVSSPRLRGRQAIADLFMRLERERQREIDGLAARQAVSKFPQRGRIQSVLRLRFLRHGALVEDQWNQQSRAWELNRSQHSSTITSLRERFNTASEQDCAGIRNSEKLNTASKQDSTTIRSAERLSAACDQDSTSMRNSVRCISASQQNSGNNKNLERCSAASVQDSADMRTAERLSEASEQESSNMRTLEKCKVAPEQDSSNMKTSEKRNVASGQSSVSIRSSESCIAASVKDSADTRGTKRLSSMTDQDSASIRSLERQVVASDCDSANIKNTQRVCAAFEQNFATMTSPDRCIRASKKDCSIIKSPSKEISDCNLDMEKSSTPNQSSEENNHHEENNLEQSNNTSAVENSVSSVTEDLHEETIPSANVKWQEAGFATDTLDSQETAAYITSSCFGLEEDLGYEEGAVSNQQYYETNLDWISDISRPRSYWEDRRQAWYQEIFESTSTNEEIRQLIERKSVSAALSSAFRARMDMLMMSCHARQMCPLDGEEEQDLSVGTFLQRHMQQFGNQEEQQALEQLHGLEECEELEQEAGKENDTENAGEEDEEQSLCPNPCHDVSGYFDGTPSSSQLPWGHYQEDHDVSDYSDQVTSTPFQQSSVVHSSDPDMQEASSFKNTSSIEMELIYDLRAHMEQLYHEMSELRKSINSCVDMQGMLQNSIREEVAAALGRSDQKEKKESNKKTPKKGYCYLCHEKKVDSLLYRCGHMCTCFKCAHELQQSTGHCPICRAQILDVVRAYTDL
ncbi:hypothetical protein Ancab_021599 [Ancistrocladus abbreviatus]